MRSVSHLLYVQITVLNYYYYLCSLEHRGLCTCNLPVLLRFFTCILAFYLNSSFFPNKSFALKFKQKDYPTPMQSTTSFPLRAVYIIFSLRQGTILLSSLPYREYKCRKSLLRSIRCTKWTLSSIFSPLVFSLLICTSFSITHQTKPNISGSISTQLNLHPQNLKNINRMNLAKNHLDSSFLMFFCNYGMLSE